MYVMGKYDKISTAKGTLEEKNVLLKQFIANELAEANRLKKVEIRALLLHKNTSYDVEAFIKQLDDQA